MPCNVTLTLLQESLTGDVGSDWQYTVRADMVDPKVFGSGSIGVPSHKLRPGATQAPPNAGEELALEAGECGGKVGVRLTPQATELDWLVDDHGSNVLVVQVKCPAPGGEPITTDAEIAARVREAPVSTGGVAVLKVKVRLVARCG